MLLQSECKTESLILRLLGLHNLSYSDGTIMSVRYKDVIFVVHGFKTVSPQNFFEIFISF